MQKISKTLAIMGLMTPLSAGALGTGEIKLYSALNQRLNAEVALIMSSGESLEDLRVNLAPAEAFAKAGIERPYYLSGLRFEIVSKGRATPAVKITSAETIREPFMSFLVELQWSQGHVLREFTLLLDPPSTFKERKAAARSVPQGEGLAPAPSGLHASSESFSGSSYGPVRAGETLWSIAKVVAPDQEVSVEQMVAALYEANPESFEKGSINGILAGSTLRVPDKGVVLRHGIAEAKKLIAGYSGARRGGAGRAAPAKPESALAAAPQPSGDKALTLLAPERVAGASAKKTASATAKGELAMEIADTVKQENEHIRSRLSGLEQQLQLMQRLLSLKDEQIAALQAGKPMPSIPANLEAPAPVAEAKPTETPAAPAVVAPETLPPVAEAAQPPAATPAPVAETPPQAAVADAAKPAGGEAAKAVEAAPVPQLQPVAATAPAAPAEPLAAATGGEPPPVTAQPPVSQPAVPPAPAGTAGAPTPAVTPPPVAAKPPAATPKPAPQPAVVEEPGFFADSFMAGLLGVVGLMVGGLALLAVKRRRAALADLDMDMPVQEIRPINVAQAVESGPQDSGGSSGLISSSQHGSFLSDFTPSDFDVLDTDNEAIDPISEADVYLAYGRYAQAEELIRQAINENPFRDECKLKLLEVFYTAQNRESFEKYVAELIDENKNSDQDFWARVVDMGRSLAPENPIFGGGKGEPFGQSAPAKPPTAPAAVAVASVPSAAAELEDADFSFDLDIGEPAPVTAEPAPAPKQAPAVVVEAAPFDATMVSESPAVPSVPEAKAEPAVADAKEDEPGLSFDLGGFDLQPEAPAAKESGIKEEEPSLEFDVSTLGEGGFSFAGVTQTPEVPEAVEKEPALEFDVSPLGEGGFSFAGVAQPAEESSDTAVEEDHGRSLDFEMPSASEPLAQPTAPPPVAEETVELDLSEFADMAAEVPAAAAAPKDDEFSFDMNFDMSAAPALEKSSGEQPLDSVEILTDMDEMETKLDLAKAYVDMENPDAAKLMLEEVRQQGDERQKLEARELLARL